MIMHGSQLTVSWDDPQGDCVSSLFDQVDNVWVGFVGYGAAVDSEDAIAHLQFPAAIRRTGLNDPPYFMGHGHTGVSSCCINSNVCMWVWVWVYKHVSEDSRHIVMKNQINKSIAMNTMMFGSLWQRP